MFPDEIDLTLHIRDICSGHHHCIFIRYHYDILTVGSVRAEGVIAASPHLVAVALEPVAGLDDILWELRDHI